MSLDYGEYTMPERTPEQVAELRQQNVEQNRRIQGIEDTLQVVRADITGIWGSLKKSEGWLIGADGQNGIRGEVRQLVRHLDMTDAAIREVNEKLHAIPGQMVKILAGAAAAGAAVTAILQYFGG